LESEVVVVAAAILQEQFQTLLEDMVVEVGPQMDLLQ
jgi:hypothetical protein